MVIIPPELLLEPSLIFFKITVRVLFIQYCNQRWRYIIKKNILFYILGEKFLRFNYGLDGNLEHYGTPYPPAYDLSRVTAPVYLYYGN